MDLATADIDCAAALLSRGATLDPDNPWRRDPRTHKLHFRLADVDPAALSDYQTGAPVFSIVAFSASRRFLLEVVKTESDQRRKR